MSKKPDDLDLIAIRELGKSSQKIEDLINDKNLKIQNLKSNRIVYYKKPEPAPKPKGDIRITKRHAKEMRSVLETEKEIKKVEGLFADKIKPAIEERALNKEADHLLPVIDRMEKEDLSILIEKGLNTYKDRQAEKQRELEQALQFDLDQEKFKEYPIYLDFDKNEKDMDREYSPSDDFE
ncbi:hypothetical protein MHTCC0001_09740 [Flavobacteriaceae bacterium MHTCC 0001]